MALYERRMIHMAPMDFDVLLRQERRKIQALWDGRVHVNCQPFPSGFRHPFRDLRRQGRSSASPKFSMIREAIFSPGVL